MPGGLLDMFGIDPIANRNNRREDSARERMIAAELEKQRLANQGQIDVEKTRGANTLANTKAQGDENRKKGEFDAMIKWAEANGLSPDSIKTLKAERDQLDKTKMGTRQTEASVGDVQSKLKGKEYGINPMPGGVNPRIAEGSRMSAEAEAVAPAQQFRKAAAIPINNPLILPNLDNPLKNSISPYLGMSKTGGYFDTKTGQMVPEQSNSVMSPGMPLFTDEDRRIAEEAERGAVTEPVAPATPEANMTNILPIPVGMFNQTPFGSPQLMSSATPPALDRATAAALREQQRQAKLKQEQMAAQSYLQGLLPQ